MYAHVWLTKNHRKCNDAIFYKLLSSDFGIQINVVQTVPASDLGLAEHMFSTSQ